MKFSTAEKFLMIAHHPDKGRFVTDHIHLEYGIIGAILLDMSLERSISLEDGKIILKSEKADTVGQTIRQVQAAIIVAMITTTAATTGARH